MLRDIKPNDCTNRHVHPETSAVLLVSPVLAEATQDESNEMEDREGSSWPVLSSTATALASETDGWSRELVLLVFSDN